MAAVPEEELAREIARQAALLGGRAYYVGGCVRDRLRGQPGKDIDLEVHGLTPDQLKKILAPLGEPIAIGESFGIFGLKGYDLDIAMPRKETNRGRGHRDFEVFVDPWCGTWKAAQRRDFTINGMMEDPLTGEVIDHFGGAADLQAGVLRHISGESFPEDPLRVLRAAQFAARFGFRVAEETMALCRTMDLSGLSRERVEEELKKALLKSERPSLFFETLRQMDQLSCWFPQLEPLIGLQQDPVHHREGDVWTHTMMVLDAAAPFRPRAKDPFGLMLAALTHDLGKAVTTREAGGRVHAYGHEEAGLPLVRDFLGRLTAQVQLTEYVLNLVEQHMKPNLLAETGASVKSTNRMFDRSLDPQGLICLALADGLGKDPPIEPEANGGFLWERLAVYEEYLSRPYVMGRDLREAGVPPSPRYGEYLAYAHKLRLAGIPKESALKQVLALARKQEKNGSKP